MTVENSRFGCAGARIRAVLRRMGQ
jgi:hypothetical protein